MSIDERGQRFGGWLRLFTAGVALSCSAAAAVGQNAVTNRRPAAPSQEPLSIEDEFPGAERAKAIVVQDPLRELVLRLDAPGYAERVEATRRLLDEPWDRDQLYALLASNELTPEQRHRLLSVVRHRLLHRPRGAVGIEVDQIRMRHSEIVIKNFVRGLPAEDVLQVGDRITHLNGNVLRDWSEFRNAVQGRTPGERIRLRVERTPHDDRGEPVLNEGGEPKIERMNIDLELGSAALLQQSAPGSLPFDSRDLARAQTAMDLYAPSTRFIPLRNGASIDGKPTFSYTLRASDVEQHVAVLAIRRQLRMLEDGELTESVELHQQWQRTADRLFNEANRSGLSDEIRRYRLMVAQRYRSLIP